MHPLMHSMFVAGAHGASRSAWIEINRPLTALAINVPIGTGASPPAPSTLPYQPPGGNVPQTGITSPVISLPIGMDIKSITCTQHDIDAGWTLVNFTFGTLNLVNPQGSSTGVNLSMFSPFLEHVDRLAPWILSKTKVDVQVQFSAFYFAISGNALFGGFSLNAFQEEQVCAIQTRIEPTDRNVGNAELLNLFRRTIGTNIGVGLPAYAQSATQSGRVQLLSPDSIVNVGHTPLYSQLHPQMAPSAAYQGQRIQ